MRRPFALLSCLTLVQLGGLSAQGGSPKRTLIDSFTTSSQVGSVVPAFNRQHIYYVLSSDTLMLYDIPTKRSTQIGVGVWRRIEVSRKGDLLVFARPIQGPTTRDFSTIWALPLDPVTGKPSGAPRRVSMSEGYWPAISPDGKWIAFAADSDYRHLRVVPSNGGKERILVNGTTAVWNPHWSPDGSEIYFSCNTGDPTNNDHIKRVTLSGGPAVTVATGDVWIDGFSIDGRRIVADDENADWTPLSFDVTGHPVPATALDSLSILAETALSPTTALESHSLRFNELVALPLSGGTPRPMLPFAANVEWVVWSPDGRQFAAMTHERDTTRLTLMNSDGTNARAIPMPTMHNDYSWSPDSRSLALVTGSRRHTLVLVDVATLKAQIAPTTGEVSSPHWMNDSKRVRYFVAGGADKGGSPSVRETAGGGLDRSIYTLPRSSKLSFWIFASDSTAIASDDSVTHLVTLTTGHTVPIFHLPTAKPTISPHGDLLVMRPPSGGLKAVVITLTGKEVATVTWPTSVGPNVLDRFYFTPDQKSLIATGRGDRTCCEVYQGFLDGTPTRLIAHAPTTRGGPGPALSPDGKTLLFTSGGPWTTIFKSIEVTGMNRKANQD